MQAKRLLSALVLCLMVSGTALAETAWKPYTSTEGRFSCQLPGNPVTRSEAKQLPVVGNTVFQQVIAMSDSSAYVIVYADLPNTGNDIESTLDGLALGMKTQLKNIQGEKKILLNNTIPGREMIGEVPGGMGYCRTQVFVVKSRMYMLMTMGATRDSLYTTEASTFFGSFLPR